MKHLVVIQDYRFNLFLALLCVGNTLYRASEGTWELFTVDLVLFIYWVWRAWYLMEITSED